MTKIKICGIRRLKDIEYLNELLPDYAGFIFASSKRHVDKEHAYDLIKNLHKSIQKVGIFVDEKPDVVLEIADKLKLQVLQFHGHENQEYINKFNGYKIWKAFEISNALSISKLDNYKCSKFLLDNTSSGSGENFDWNLAEKKVDGRNIMLAGGLNSENVEQGIIKFKPYGVDVSSGVEVNGFKDYNKIKEFIKKVREL